MKTFVKIYQIGKRVWPLLKNVIAVFTELMSHNINLFKVHVDAFAISAGAPFEQDGVVILPVTVHANITFPTMQAALLAAMHPEMITAHINDRVQSSSIPIPGATLSGNINEDANA